ncbi:alpha-glucosidase [Paenibacillus aquistagni]|uniref:Trehalose-6-phosphate hydrolase n=1 Tax=Paenibacillus aquistagni TaxID=1852522 RepID=A0A1X7LG22_9BACL|nr:alpha-glucosidase [Paenibacillus aquistagni]SMG52119.1 trehalose-6-phosphate hydrolase [Paenibacillus aquistagni]
MDSNVPWWRRTAFYEIYMPSFCDGNQDGIGDFRGIASKLDELKALGIGGIWLTPFYKSPKVDNGYDIADYYAIDPDYGTMEDFDAFIKTAHERDIRVIVDLVLNHTSSAHPWFQASKSSKDHPKRDWYIWQDPVDGGMPNNWESFFGGPAWEYDEASGQYYYHAFATEQVDLNWANPEVRAAMKDVMGFWLDKGIDGFRLDVINFLKVSGQFPDNPYQDNGEQDHRYDKDQAGILDAIREICEFVHQREGAFMVGEVGSEEMSLLKQYSGDGLLDVVFNFNLGSQETYQPSKLIEQVLLMEEVHRSNQVPTLFFSSHDMARHISRFGEGDPELEVLRAKLMAAFMLTAKGVPFLYYGDEIGMRDYYSLRIEDMRDIQGLTHYDLAIKEGLSEEEALKRANEKSRDKSRTPMQWDGSEYSGFSQVKPWIAMGPRHNEIHVAAEQSNPDSIYVYYQQLLRLRRLHPSLAEGGYSRIERAGEVLIYTKIVADDISLVALNFGAEPVEIDLSEVNKHSLQLALTSQSIEDHQAGEKTVLPGYAGAVWTTRL